jgi:hypothetical protein
MAGGGAAIDQAANRHARVGDGGEALLAERLGVPAFIGLLIAADRVGDHDGGMAILPLVGKAKRHGDADRRCRRLARQELAEVRVNTDLHRRRLRGSRQRHHDGKHDCQDADRTHLSGSRGR